MTARARPAPRLRLTDTERHYVRWMLGFFCTAESLVANNLAMAIYPHVPIPEARLYLGRRSRSRAGVGSTGDAGAPLSDPS